MSDKQLTQPEHTSFESLKHESEGAEFWYARELQTVLDYSTWDKFERVIKKAITAVGFFVKSANHALGCPHRAAPPRGV